MLGEHTVQCTLHAVGMPITAAKRDYTGPCGPACGDQRPEAEGVDQQHTSLLPGLLHTALVWSALQSLVGEMRRIMSKRAEESHGLGGNAHIG